MDSTVGKRIESHQFLETEVKILGIDPSDFPDKMATLGAILTIPRRLISDLGYKANVTEKKQAEDFTLESELIANQDLDTFLKLLEKLGVEIVTEGQENYELRFSGLKQAPKTIRIRQDGDKIFLTFKFKRDGPQEDKTMKIREEYDIEVKDMEKAKEFFKNLGFGQETRRQKYRTTCEMAVSRQKVKIELNEGPRTEVSPWIEIEGPNRKIILETAQKLGYSENDLKPISDSQLYRDAGVTDKEIVFN